MNPRPPDAARLMRSRLPQLLAPDSFLWMAGIEDTFITAVSPKTGRSLDEYALTGHYERWAEDLELFRQLGLPAVRYGIPWHRINPAPGVWDFSWTDGPLERLLELGIEPIIDLVHYGVPAWIEGAYLAPDFDQRMAEYAARVAERYRGRIHAYTPLNEPRIAAWYCGRLGWWPPFRHGWRGFVQVLLGACRGIVRTVQALRAVDPEILVVHVDAGEAYLAEIEEAELEASRRQLLVFVALDLVTGRIAPGSLQHRRLLERGATEAELNWLQAHPIEPDLIGINLYPMYSDKRLVPTASGHKLHTRYASGEIVDRLCSLYWQRYGRPLVISETSALGAVTRRRAWLETSVAAVARVRAEGIPLVGYTWWPLYALVTWAYRQGRKTADEYLRQMGLWDLHPEPGGLVRVPTPLVAQYRDIVAAGAAAVGPLAPRREDRRAA